MAQLCSRLPRVTLGVLRGHGLRQFRIAAEVVTAFLLTCVSVAFAGRSPVLGWGHAFPHGKGFGLVRPRHDFLGGDPTHDVADDERVVQLDEPVRGGRLERQRVRRALSPANPQGGRQ
jgi:hypothetical protein